MIKSPLRYPGGKSRAVKHILSLLPHDVQTLCSPFLGGGSVELACASKGIKVHAYDAFEPLVNFWQALLNDTPALGSMIDEYYPLTRKKFHLLQKRYVDIHDDVQRAAIFFVLNRCSFSGTTFSGGMSSCHDRFTENAIHYVYAFKIDNFSVEYADFKDSIKKHSDDFLYLDPPYLLNQKLYGKKGDMHNGFDHAGLAALLKKRERWILSYNNCPEVQDLYKGYTFIVPEWAYSMNNTKLSNEVIILSKDFHA
jgi:DNA adenine methylase